MDVADGDVINIIEQFEQSKKSKKKKKRNWFINRPLHYLLHFKTIQCLQSYIYI